MTVLTPCRRCHRRADCQIMRDTLAGLKGLRISKANLLCKIPRQDFPVGARVSVEAFRLVEGGYADEDYVKGHVRREGIVARWKGLKATVALDKGQEIERPEGRPIAHLHAEPDRLARIEGAPVDMCACGGISKERCEAQDYPTTRDGGGWYCRTVDEKRQAEWYRKEIASW